MKKAIVLLSGGMDSVTAAAYVKSEGYDLYALSFDYGQNNRAELHAARQCAAWLRCKQHVVLPLALNDIVTCALTTGVGIPTERTEEQRTLGVPVTYVPSRNIVFLSLASSWAETVGTKDLVIGISGFSVYPDSRRGFIDAFEQVLEVGTSQSFWKIHTPLVTLTKSEIIKLGVSLSVDYSFTCSCYQARLGHHYKWYACGKCDTCLARKEGFKNAGIADPTLYLEE